MAIQALCALRATVDVVMAGHAIALQGHFEDRIDMTGAALEWFMCAVQRMPGVSIMVELHGGPGSADMAGIARVTEMACMVVVFQVAAGTSSIELVRERILAMAIATGQVRMAASQRKPCVTCMIEARIAPSGRRMAIAALLAATSVMGVIFGMAAVAGGPRVPESLVRVAGSAFSVEVVANEREPRGVMIKLDVQPAAWRVAVAALRPHRLAMHIVWLMTGEAVRRCFSTFLFRFVTIIALCFAMLAR